MAMVLFLAGCSSPSHNQIGPMELSDDQQELMDIITIPGHEILLFDFETSDTFENVEIWLDVYSYGELIESGQGIHQVGHQEPLDGRLAVIISSTREDYYQTFHWTFTMSGGAGARFESPPIESAGLGRAFGAIREPVDIQDGQEIILYVSKFSRGGIRMFDDFQAFAEQPELHEEYPYVHIIKARFSN